MSSVVPLRTMRNEASEWLVRLQSESVTDHDRRQFEDWAAADPQRREIYAQLAGTWRRLELLSHLNGVTVKTGNTSASRRRRRWVVAAVVAAGMAAIFISSALVVRHTGTGSIQTAVGEQRRIALADASTLELNTNSRVFVDFKKNERLVQLERGEARFKVAHQPQRPFIVEAGGHFIRAVGTEFTVRIDNSGVDVLVLEGAVSFRSSSGAGSPVMVRAGQSAASSQLNKVFPIAPEELERRLAWHDGMVSFRGETLREVLAELGRYNQVHFAVVDEAAANIRVSGYFRATDMPAFLARLEENFPVWVRRDAGKIVVVSRTARPEPAE